MEKEKVEENFENISLKSEAPELFSPLPLRELVLNFMAKNSLYLLRGKKEKSEDCESGLKSVSCKCSAL